MLTFDEPTHTYKYAGEELVSVTQVIGQAFNTYGFMQQTEQGRAELEKAAAFGRSVHSMCEMHLLGTLDEDALDPLLLPYLEGFKKFVVQVLSVHTGVVVEQKTYSEKLMFAGTADIVTDTAVFDIKTRAYNKTTDPLQLAAYDRLFGGNGNSLQHFVVEILPDDYRLTKCNNANAWPVFKTLLDNYWQNKKIETLIKNWKER